MTLRKAPSGPYKEDETGSQFSLITRELIAPSVDIVASPVVQLTAPVVVPEGFERCALTWNLGCFNTAGFNGAPMAFILSLEKNGASPLLNLGQLQWRTGGPGSSGGDIRTGSLQLDNLQAGDSLIFFANENTSSPYGAGRTRIVNAPLSQDGYTRFQFWFWSP